MENTADPNSPSNGTSSGPSNQRPDFFPAKFWDDKNPLPADVLQHPSLVNLAKSYASAEAEATRRAQADAERAKGLPPAADKYDLKLPAELMPKGIMVLTEKPGPDFKAPDGQRVFVLDPNDPLLATMRQAAFDAKIPQAEFHKHLAGYVGALAAKQDAEQKQLEAWRAEDRKALGEHADKRIEHVTGKLTALVGEDAVKALDVDYLPAKAIEALETLLEKAGEPKFAPGSSTTPGTTGAAAARAEIQRLMADQEFAKKFLDRHHPDHEEARQLMLRLHEQAAAA